MYIKYIRKNPSTPIMISVPHAGQIYPNEFLLFKKLSLNNLKVMEDFQCQKILDKVNKDVADIIIAKCSRSVVDLNRSRNAIDEDMFDDKILMVPAEETLMLSSGLGVIPKKCYEDFIFHSKLPKLYATNLLENIYDPYHKTIKNNLKKLQFLFGCSMLIDLHSMPSKVTNKKSADIVVGDNFGKSCSTEIKNYIFNFFKSKSLNVTLNNPYSGGYITRNYGKKSSNCHAIQIEINKSLYMNEKNYDLNNNLKFLQEIFSELLNLFPNLKDLKVKKTL